MALSITLIAIAAIFAPKPHSVNVQVTPVGDFAFDSSCAPINQETPVNEAVRILTFDRGGHQVSSSSITGTWTKKKDYCEFTSNVWLPTGSSSYVLQVVAEDQINATLRSSEVPWSISGALQVGKTYTISGSLVIKNSLDSYDLAECGTSIMAFGGECGSIYFTWEFGGNGKANECQGAGGFNDLGSGTPVTVLDDKGKVVATGSMGQGLIEKDAFTDGLKKRQLNCPIPFSVTKVPGLSTSYLVQVGDRGERRYSMAELEEADWQVDYQIGN